MDKTQLDKILADHELWLANKGGKRADLTGADLTLEDLTQADLRGADLTQADLRGADLTRADLRWADLRWADLSGANLRGADLTRADLTGADLTGADIDFSCWPMWCGSRDVKVDRRIAAQLAAYFCALDCDDPDYQAARAAILEFAKTSHRAAELGLRKDGER